MFEKAYRELAERLDLPRGSAILDIGCGTGYLARALASLESDVTGIDISHTSLVLARQNHPGRLFAEGDMTGLPFPDNRFDFATAVTSLEFCSDRAGAVAEVYRVLKPGGIAVITDLDAHRHTWLRDEHHDRWLGFNRDDVRTWFRTARLNDARVDDLGDDCRAASRGGRDAAISIFIASGRAC